MCVAQYNVSDLDDGWKLIGSWLLIPQNQK